MLDYCDKCKEFTSECKCLDEERINEHMKRKFAIHAILMGLQLLSELGYENPEKILFSMEKDSDEK